MKLTAGHVIAARGLLGLSQEELAESIGRNPQTISRFEKGERVPGDAILDKIREELEKRGIEFTNGTGTGVRLDHAKAAAYSRSVAQTRKDSGG